MRKALIVGIDYYKHIANLKGCVNDAFAVSSDSQSRQDLPTSLQNCLFIAQ